MAGSFVYTDGRHTAIVRVDERQNSITTIYEGSPPVVDMMSPQFLANATARIVSGFTGQPFQPPVVDMNRYRISVDPHNMTVRASYSAQ